MSIFFKNKIQTKYYNDGGKYVGEFANNKRNGKGKYYFPNGAIYDGNWHEGKQHGYGIYYGANGSTYDGEWFNGKSQGYGICHYADGTEYDGEWVSGVREGNGIAKYKNGTSYDGEWFNDKQSGYGTMKYNDGTLYEGEWLANKRHGYGKFKYKDGVYDGTWKNDIRYGIGIDTKKNGHIITRCLENNKTIFGQYHIDNESTYVGEIDGNTKTGYGIQTLSDNTVLKGEWKNNKLNGVGTTIYDSKNKYEGLYIDGRFNGLGIYTFESGKTYYGYFKDNNFDGFGMMNYPNNELYIGFWKNDQIYYGMIEKEEGIYIGEFNNNKIHGYGKFIYNEGYIFLGEFKEGMKHGYGIVLKDNEIIISGIWENNKLIKKIPIQSEILSDIINMSKMTLIRYSDGAKYIGEMNNEDMDGFGIIINTDGSSVIANFHQNEMIYPILYLTNEICEITHHNSFDCENIIFSIKKDIKDDNFYTSTKLHISRTKDNKKIEDCYFSDMYDFDILNLIGENKAYIKKYDGENDKLTTFISNNDKFSNIHTYDINKVEYS